MTTPAKSAADRVVIFDTTLRDGEQSPGATMTHEEKLQVAEVLDAMGVDVIEAGFPIASEGDFAAVHEIAQRTKTAVVCGLARAGHKDIDRAGEAIRPAKRGRIHTFISTSPVHMKWKLQMEPQRVYEMVIASVTRARSFTDDVEWSCEDGTRTEHDFLCRCVEAAIKAGATTINIPDTVGYAVPEEYYDLFKRVRETVPNSDKAVFSVHCHNDLGMAVANSMAGIRARARQIECTINGIGERAGNQLEDAFVRFKALADRKKHIYDEDIESLIDEGMVHAYDRIKLVSLTVIAGTHGPQRATMKLNIDGETRIEEAEGNGPVDAVFNCIKSLVPHEAKLELYQVHAVTEGTDAQAEVSVRLSQDGRSMTARAADPDTLVGPAQAYLGALNKIVMKRQRDIPAAAAS